MYRIVLERGAIKDMAALSNERRALVLAKLRSLAADPQSAQQVKSLKGRLEGLYRLRVGDWRAIYAIDHAERVIAVVGVKQRGGAYD